MRSSTSPRSSPSNVRPKDLIARFGGEEFCVLLPDTLAVDAEQVAQRLRIARSARSRRRLPEPVTVSIGVAVVEAGNTPMELAVVLARADQALYRAKLEGRNTVRIAGPAADADRGVRETWEPPGTVRRTARTGQPTPSAAPTEARVGRREPASG